MHSGENARVRRLYWVYGEEDMFRFLAVRRIKDLCQAQQFNTLNLSAMDTPETEVWANLNQHPLDSEQKRLIIVHEAQRLEHLDRLAHWLKDNQGNRKKPATAVFVSNDADWADEVKEIFSKSSAAQYVKCALPKDETDRLKRAQDIICTWGHGNIDRTSAGVLALRVNFDMAEAYAVMAKAALFPQAKVTVSAIEKLAPRHVEEDVVWALLSLNKRKAAEAVVVAGPEVTGRVLGTLATHVDMLARINSVLTVSTGAKDAAKRIGAREQYVRRLYPLARLYPRKEAVRRTLLLSRLDAAFNQGAREGVLESLLALW